MIPGDLLSAFPHRQFHTLPGLLDSWAALPNSKHNACMPMQGGSLYHFYDGLWYDPAERRTHDLPCERRSRYRLSQPDTVTQHTMVQKDICFMIMNSHSHEVNHQPCKTVKQCYNIHFWLLLPACSCGNLTDVLPHRNMPCRTHRT